MNVDVVLAAYRQELRDLARDGETLERMPLVTWRTFANGQVHDVTAFALDEANADAAIHEARDRALRLGAELEWKTFSFDAPPDLKARLQRAGFAVGPKETLVAYDLAAGLAPFEGPFSCEVRRVERIEALGDFRAVAEAAFGKDYALTTDELAEALRSGRRGHDAYVAYAEDGEAASAGRLYTAPGSRFAGLYGGGTRPGYRGRGIYRAVVAARARDAAALGARYLTVDALPTSLPILRRLGFVPLADTWPCALEPGTERA